MSECFRVYKKVSDSYEDHSIFLSTGARYAFLFKFDQTDYISWARGLKRAGYATNPAYADKLINLIESYGLDRFDYGEAGVTRYVGTHEPMLAHDLVYIITRPGDTMQELRMNLVSHAVNSYDTMTSIRIMYPTRATLSICTVNIGVPRNRISIMWCRRERVCISYRKCMECG